MTDPPKIQIATDTFEGHFIRRQNRFAALVKVDGQERYAFLPNPGRLTELLYPGARILLRKSESGERKTSVELVGAITSEAMVLLDSTAPNRLLYAAFKANAIPWLRRFNRVKHEVPLGRSRLDFKFENNSTTCFVETKSCTLVVNGTALFPDAPTERGTRHVRDLTSLRITGNNSAIFFLIQRPDAERFSANASTDKEFADAFITATGHGVKAYAYLSSFDGRSLTLGKRVQVDLGF